MQINRLLLRRLKCEKPMPKNVGYSQWYSSQYSTEIKHITIHHNTYRISIIYGAPSVDCKYLNSSPLSFHPFLFKLLTSRYYGYSADFPLCDTIIFVAHCTALQGVAQYMYIRQNNSKRLLLNSIYRRMRNMNFRHLSRHYIRAILKNILNPGQFTTTQFQPVLFSICDSDSGSNYNRCEAK